MQYRGKGVVVVMEQPLPILVFFGLTESLFVGGDTLPSDEKKIMVFALEASLKFMRNITRHGRDNGPGLHEMPVQKPRTVRSECAKPLIQESLEFNAPVEVNPQDTLRVGAMDGRSRPTSGGGQR